MTNKLQTQTPKSQTRSNVNCLEFCVWVIVIYLFFGICYLVLSMASHAKLKSFFLDQIYPPVFLADRPSFRPEAALVSKTFNPLSHESIFLPPLIICTAISSRAIRFAWIPSAFNSARQANVALRLLLIN